ncbi:MAG: M20 metallopeptidase family protein [Gemmatimonadota bacterium]
MNGIRRTGATAFAATLLFPCTLVAQDLDRRVDAAVERSAPEIIRIRHRVHENPELGNRERETAALVAEHLRALGLEVRTGIAHTGVVAVLKGGKPGPVVAVRADMDALPVTERTDLPFKSTKRTTYLGQEVGVAHACGHDIHTSVALGVASALASIREDLPGTVKFIFQPAEEGPPPGERGGADLMMEAGVLANPRPGAIFALHSFPDFEVGQVGVTPGPAMAAVDQFVARIRGRQSHGAYPHLGVDPIVMAAQAVLALQTIRSRNLSPLEPSVVSVGIVRGGERFNIIPEAVHLEGTVRTYSEGARNEVERRMREILDGITRAGGGSFELDYRRNTPATINDPELTARMRPTLERVLGGGNVIEAPPTMGGEDFAYFANEVPGFYFRLGVVKPGTESGGLHTPTFRADDAAIPVGMRAMAHLVLSYLRAGA